MSRARILADYVSSGDELALKAPLASPAFTGTPTGITAAHLEAGVLPSDITGGAGILQHLGTVLTGNLTHPDISFPTKMEDIGGGAADFPDNTSGDLIFTDASETPTYMIVHFSNRGSGTGYNAGYRHAQTWTSGHYDAGITGFNSWESASDNYYTTIVFQGFTSTGCEFTRTPYQAPGGHSYLIYRFYK